MPTNGPSGRFVVHTSLNSIEEVAEKNEVITKNDQEVSMQYLNNDLWIV